MEGRTLRVYARDINGKWFYGVLKLGEVPSSAEEESEIMMVSLEGRLLYNALRDAPITWDDLRGFWS